MSMLPSIAAALRGCTCAPLLGLLALASCAQRPPLQGDVALGRYVEPTRRFTFRLPGYARTYGLADRVEGTQGELQIPGLLGVHPSLAWKSIGAGGSALQPATMEVWSARTERLVGGYGSDASRVSWGLLPSENGDFFHEIWEVHREGRFASNQALFGFAVTKGPKAAVWLAHSMVLWNPSWGNEGRRATEKEVQEERAVLRDLIERISFDDPLLLEFTEEGGSILADVSEPAPRNGNPGASPRSAPATLPQTSNGI